MEHGETTINTRATRFLQGVIPPIETPDTLPHDNTTPHDQYVDTIHAEHDTKADGVTVREDEHAVGALERVRLFVRDKKRFASVVGVISIAALAPNAYAQESGSDLTWYVDNPDGTFSNVPGVSPEERRVNSVNTYPYANTPVGSKDSYGYDVRECASYARHKVIENGTSPNRAVITYNLDRYREQGESMSPSPTPGSVGIKVYKNGGHAIYVESVDHATGQVIMSEYNGKGGAYKHYSWSESIEQASNGTYTYVHFELPAPRKGEAEADKAVTYENLKKLRTSTITAKRPVREGTFIRSKNDQYRLVVQKGNIKLRDTEKDDKVRWSAKTNKRADRLQVKLGKGDKRGKNTLVFGSNKKDYKKWNIGSATKIEVGNDGKLAGYRGKRQVWEANSIAAVPRVAKLSMSKISSKRAKALGR